MTRKQYILLIITVILGIMIITNPSVQMHKDEVKRVIQKKINETSQSAATKSSSEDPLAKLGNSFGQIFGQVFIDNIISNTIDRDNYLFFSLTKFNYQSHESVIGFGILNSVFISTKVSELLNKPNSETAPDNVREIQKDIPVKQQIIQKDYKEKIREMLDSGQSVREISKKTGIRMDEVRKIKKEMK